MAVTTTTFSMPFSLNPHKPSTCRYRSLSCSAITGRKGFSSRYAHDEPRKGADIIVEALERQGVEIVFAYPGGASVEIHQALTRSSKIRNILPRHEQGGFFAAEGYARSSGKPGICIATSGPGATNLVTGLADAMFDSVPIVTITGQVSRHVIGTDAFQETPIVELTRLITKHNYLVMDIVDTGSSIQLRSPFRLKTRLGDELEAHKEDQGLFNQLGPSDELGLFLLKSPLGLIM